MQATALSQKGIESMRGRKDPEAVRVVAREMESLFAYEMVKAMRSASDTSAAGGKGFGGEVYGTMFDMELARLLSSKGLGLQEMILKGMGQAASPAAAGVSLPAAREAFVLPSASGEGAAPAESVSAAGPSADAVSVDGAAARNPAPHTRQPLEESVALHTHDSAPNSHQPPAAAAAEKYGLMQATVLHHFNCPIPIAPSFSWTASCKRAVLCAGCMT
jgi:Rod binding domain-containing protein